MSSKTKFIKVYSFTNVKTWLLGGGFCRDPASEHILPVSQKCFTPLYVQFQLRIFPFSLHEDSQDSMH